MTHSGSKERTNKAAVWALVALIALLVIYHIRRNGDLEREWRGASQASNSTSAGARASAFQKKWEFSSGGIITAGLALGDDGRIYAACEDGFLYALDSSGQLQWKFNAGQMKAAPVVGSDGTVYVFTTDERFYAVNHDGTQQWFSRGGPYADKGVTWRGLASDGTDLYGPWRGQVQALRLSNGDFDFDAGVSFEFAGSISLLTSGLIVYPGAGRINAIDSTGKTSWQYPAMDPPLTVDYLLAHNGRPPIGNFWLDSAIAVGDDGTLYAAASGTSSRFVALTSDGRLRWEFPLASRTTNYASPVVATDGTVYFSSGDGVIYAFTRDGTKKWNLETGSSISTTPLLSADGTLIAVNAKDILAISPEGKIVEQQPFGGAGISSPTLATDGTLYVVSRTKIFSFSTRHTGLMTSSWPKFQHDIANSGRASSF